MEPFVSLCMIVKNEEKVLQRCLDSVVNIIDEIIIVDSGSTDKTKEIAQQYTDKIYDYEWNDSFGEARNFAKSKAQGKWILVLDADEYVDRGNLEDVVRKLKEEDSYDAFEVKIYNFIGFNGERIVQHKSVRLYKNLPSIFYYRTIHEQLTREDQELSVSSSNLVLYHSGYLNKTVKEKDKGNRNAMLIEKEINTSGYSGFDYFNLGNEYSSKGDNEKALENYLKAYKNKPDFSYSWVSFCVIQIINCLINLKRFKDALSVISDAENIYSQTPDFKCLKGYVFFLQHRYEDAKSELENLIENKEYYQLAITSIDYLEFYPSKILGDIYELEGNYQEALNYYSKTLQYNSKSLPTLVALMKIAIKYVDVMEIYEFLEQQGIINSQHDIKNLIRVIANIPGSLPLIEKYLLELDKEDDIRGILIKNRCLNKEYDKAYEILGQLSVRDLEGVLKEGIFDFIDFLILCLTLNKNNFLRSMTGIIENTSDIINFLLDLEYNSVPDEKIYLSLLERCIAISRLDLFEVLAVKKNAFGPKINLKIGNLLYRYNLPDNAIQYFQEIDAKDFDEEAYTHIINSLLQQNYYNDALMFIFNAIEQGFKNYELFQKAILVLDKLGADDDKNEVMKMVLIEYGDSNIFNGLQNPIV